MNFFDIKPESLPFDGQYYFNILVIVMAVNKEAWTQLVADTDIQGLECIWYTDEITSPQPKAYCIYLEDSLREDELFEISIYPHKVVEISGNDISWYDMIDFDTDDPWSIDGYMEGDDSDYSE